MAKRPTAEWLGWKAKLDHCGAMIDRCRASPAAVDEKWLRKTVSYWDDQKKKLIDKEPPKFPPAIDKLHVGVSKGTPFPVHRPIVSQRVVPVKRKPSRRSWHDNEGEEE